MNRIISLLLCAMMTLSIVSCNKATANHERTEAPTGDRFELSTDEAIDSTSKEPASDEAFLPLSFSGEYADTLTIIRDMIDFTFRYKALDTYLEKALMELDFGSLGKPDWFDDIAKAIFENSLLRDAPQNYSQTSKATYAYFVKDLNADGIDELFLFCSDRLIAVFTQAQKKNVLIDAYGSDEIAYFYSNGLLRVEWNHQPRFGMGNSGYSYPDSIAVYRLLSNGDRLTLLDHVGTYYNGDHSYYRIVNGERTSITYEEYSIFRDTYPNDNGIYDGLEIMHDAGLEYFYFYSFPSGK